MKIRSKLILAFLAISLSSMILISFLFYSNEKKNLTRQIFNHLESVASIQHNRIKAINDQNIVRLKLVASRTQLRISLRDFNIERDPYYQGMMVQNLEDAKMVLKDFRNICIISLDGIIIASTDSDKIGKNIVERDFFVRGLTEYSVDQFFLDKNQNLLTRLSGPLFLNSQLLGVLIIVSEVENIISSVSDYTGLEKTGETILARRMENGDALFIMPTRFEPDAALKLRIAKERQDIPIIQSFYGKPHLLSDAVDYREVPVLAVTRYIEDIGWGLVVKTDLAEALAPVIGMRNLIAYLIVAATFFILFISIYFSKHITRPIIQLTETAKKITKGDYTVLADESMKDETGILAHAFNSMTANLIKSHTTLEKKIEELSESEEQVRNLLNSTAEAIFGLDMNANCTFCNPSCLSLLKYKKDDELLGKNIHQLMHHTREDGTLYPPEKCRILKLLQSKIPVHDDSEVLWCSDGSSFWAEYWAYPVIRDHEIIGAVVTFIDISERKAALAEKEKLNAQLQQSQKMEAIGTLSGGISHDFNNILTAMIGYAELVQIKSSGQDDILRYAEEVISAGQRAKELVRQILTFSRQSEHERRPLEIYLIVKEVLKLIRASIPSTIEIRENIDTKSGVVLADPTQIHQVLMNLCTNAYHAMQETGGILTIALGRIDIQPGDMKIAGFGLPPGPYVKLQVTDTGCGMDRAVRERIFEPYFTTKDKGEGTGMGLALTHGIVKNHDGHIIVSSEPGKGSMFQVYLPRMVSETTRPSREDEEMLPKGSERILLVDDEVTIMEMEQQMLEMLDYQVTATSNCVEAFQLFANRPDDFDLIITDMTMPEMTGAELARKVLIIRPEIPIILCTGFSELINEKKAKAIGIRKYIMKPIVTRELVTVVRKLLDEKKVHRKES
ncbi:MAG: response regulator [Desulfobacteraceae bacterium]|nr:response regulator [Desulfobacteraceae bacterium]